MTDKKTTELIVTVRNIEKQVTELKSDIKKDYLTKEGSYNIQEQVKHIQEQLSLEIREIKEDVKGVRADLSKVVWIVLTAVISAILYLIIK